MEVLHGHVVTGRGGLARTGHHDRRVIDVAAVVRLRDALGLHDGDPVDIVVG